MYHTRLEKKGEEGVHFAVPQPPLMEAVMDGSRRIQGGVVNRPNGVTETIIAHLKKIPLKTPK